MTRLKTLALSTAFMFAAVSVPACAQQAPETSVNTADRAAIEAIIHDYLMENPEVIEDALVELERREKAAMLARIEDDLYNNPNDVTLGPDNAKVTIVEFFDYNCGFCKTSTAWVQDTLDKHPKDVRVVFKELPLLDSRTKTSRNAAKAAIAASRQGKYGPMHFALMKARGLTSERLESIAREVGLDVEMWKADMEDERIDALLEETFVLARKIPDLTGTPFFIVNGEMVNGANIDRLNALVAEALES
jgi:protein-disulfide isomerase